MKSKLLTVVHCGSSMAVKVNNDEHSKICLVNDGKFSVRFRKGMAPRVDIRMG